MVFDDSKNAKRIGCYDSEYSLVSFWRANLTEILTCCSWWTVVIVNRMHVNDVMNVDISLLIRLTITLNIIG